MKSVAIVFGSAMEGLRGKILSFLSPLGSMTFQRYSTVQTIIDEYRDNRDFIGDI